MAPRGRKKVGLKRIDAAVDALVPLGFSKDLVTKTVNNLLKVYDGNEGWVFIEEGCYRLVIDAILEAQENEGTQVIVSGEPMEQEVENAIVAAEITEQVVQDDPTSPPLEATVDALDSGENADLLPTSCTAPSMMTGLHLENEAAFDTGEAGQRGNISFDVWLPQECQPCVTPPLRPRRPPCYGWISEDEDDDDEELRSEANAVSREQRVEGGCYSCHERKRPSGWDQKPSDIR